jgi:hypothetical protein
MFQKMLTSDLKQELTEHNFKVSLHSRWAGEPALFQRDTGTSYLHRSSCCANPTIIFLSQEALVAVVANDARLTGCWWRGSEKYGATVGQLKLANHAFVSAFSHKNPCCQSVANARVKIANSLKSFGIQDFVGRGPCHAKVECVEPANDY